MLTALTHGAASEETENLEFLSRNDTAVLAVTRKIFRESLLSVAGNLSGWRAPGGARHPDDGAIT